MFFAYVILVAWCLCGEKKMNHQTSRSQESEDRGQRTEDRGQTTEIAGKEHRA